jgi:predicted DNA-binding transcriptional regulator AlpA
MEKAKVVSQKKLYERRRQEPMPDKLLRVNEVAEMLSISPQTIRNSLSWKKNNFPIVPVRVNGAVRFSLQAVQELIARSHIKE